MHQRGRLGSASALACAFLVLASGPASGLGVVPAPGPVTIPPPVTPPLPSVPVPTLPPPEVPAPEAPEVKLPEPQEQLAGKGSEPLGEATQPRVDGGDQGSGDSGQAGTANDHRSGPERERRGAGTSSPRRSFTSVKPGLEAAARTPVAAEGPDLYLLSLVLDDLCAVLPSILKPMPDRVSGLSPAVISRLPAGIVNAVPEQTLADASFSCGEQDSAAAEVAGTDDADDTRVLGMLPHSAAIVVAVLPVAAVFLGIGFLFLRLGRSQGAHARR